MPLTVKHSKVSAVADGPDTNLVRPSDWNADHQITGLDSITEPIATTVNSTSPAMKITQTGTGNALVVEDAASDGTPFVVDASGNVILQDLSARTVAGFTPGLQMNSYSSSSASALSQTVFRNDTGGVYHLLNKSRGTSAASHVVVQSGDDLGVIQFNGSDGTNFVPASSIMSEVDGTPGPNDMPGRLVFSTTADGASTPTERMRIDSAGNVGIGGTSIAGFKLSTYGNIAGATTAYNYYGGGVFQSDVTVSGIGCGTFLGTQAAAFTLTTLSHHRAAQGTIGAGSTVTNQFGFEATSSLTGATNNAGFFGNIPAGTGRYNFYAAGTADNYFAGNVGIGNLAEANVVLSVRGAQRNHRHNANDAAPIYHANVKARGTSGAPLTVNNGDGLVSYQAYAYDGSGERPASAIVMQVDGVPATSTVPGRIIFSTAPAGTSQTPIERMRIDSAGNTALSTRLKFNGLAGSTPSGAQSEIIHNAGASIDYGLYLRHYNGTAYDAEVLVGGDASNGGSTVRVQTGGTERMRIDSSGNVGIGGSPGANRLHVLNTAGSTLTHIESDAETALILVENQTNAGAADIQFRKARGGYAAKAIVSSGDTLGAIAFAGHNGVDSFSGQGARIAAFVDGTPSATSMPGGLFFSTTPAGSMAATERLRIDSTGNVLVKSAAGLGYGAGAGGQVTQVTSKSTAVTLNTPTGQITMNNAALAAGATVTFPVSNSLVSGTDLIIAHYKGGGTSYAYQVYTDSCYSGGFTVSVKNLTGGSLSEAVVINFAIIKGATA